MNTKTAFEAVFYFALANIHDFVTIMNYYRNMRNAKRMKGWRFCLNIGNIKMKYGLMLAPLAGVSDCAFRQVCRSFGAESVTSEMISAKGMHYNDLKTADLAFFEESEAPFFVQIFGSEPEIMAEAAHKLATNTYKACRTAKTPDGIDINMGCPVPKVAGNGDGSALMRDIEKARRIIKAVSQAVDIPVTVKMRSGWDGNSVNAVELACAAEENGASAVCIHGRTKEQMYRDPVNLDIIKEVKRHVSIPVIGNGGIMCAEDALRMYDYTGCDGIMIARGAEGNPWIFSEITAAIEGKEYTSPTLKERLDVAKLHIKKMIEYKGEFTAIAEARKHMAWYIKGFEGAASARFKINSVSTYRELEKVIDELQSQV